MNPPAWLVMPYAPRRRSLRRFLLPGFVVLVLLLEFQLYIGPNTLLLGLVFGPVMPAYKAAREVLFTHPALVGFLLIALGVLVLLAHRQLRYLRWQLRTAFTRGAARRQPVLPSPMWRNECCRPECCHCRTRLH